MLSAQKKSLMWHMSQKTKAKQKSDSSITLGKKFNFIHSANKQGATALVFQALLCEGNRFDSRSSTKEPGKKSSIKSNFILFTDLYERCSEKKN